LKLVPLFRRQHLLQSLIRLAANLLKLRLRLFPQLVQLRTCVTQYLMYLCLLLGAKLKTIEHLFKTTAVCPCSGPFLIDIERQRATYKPKQKDDCSRGSNLPFALGSIIHGYLAASSATSYRVLSTCPSVTSASETSTCPRIAASAE